MGPVPKLSGSTDYIWYNLRATGWKPDDSEQNFGVITADYFPRPSYAAFAALSFACQGLDFDGVTRTTEAALASRGEKTVVWRASVSGMRGDAFRFNVSIDDDDGPGRDVTLTMPKPVDILFRENLK